MLSQLLRSLFRRSSSASLSFWKRARASFAVVTRVEAQPRLGRARASRGSESGGDPGPFRPTSATHKILFQRRTPSSRFTPDRISHAIQEPPFHDGGPLRRSVHRRASFLPRARRTACLWRPCPSCCERSGRAPRPHIARTVSRPSVRRVKRQDHPGDRLQTPSTPLHLPLASDGIGRNESRALELHGAEEIARAMKTSFCSFNRPAGTSRVPPVPAPSCNSPRGEPPLSRSTGGQRAA